MVLFDQNFKFLLKMDNQKISYERRVYESVDDKNYKPYSKTDEKKNSGVKWLINNNVLTLQAAKYFTLQNIYFTFKKFAEY